MSIEENELVNNFAAAIRAYRAYWHLDSETTAFISLSVKYLGADFALEVADLLRNAAEQETDRT